MHSGGQMVLRRTAEHARRKEVPTVPDTVLTDSVKAMALELGADLVGVAPVDRYANAPLMMSPQGHLPEARCVVVVAIHHPDAAIELGGEANGQNSPHHSGPYNIQGTMNTKLECISFQLSRFLEDSGCRVVAIPATNVWRFRPYKEIDTPFAPDLSDIHAGVAAGLGEFGFSGLLLTPEFGPRQRLCCLVTDADLVPSPLYDGPPLCDKCMECLKWCPTEAFNKETDGEVELEIGGKTFTYCKKNKWRCSWAEHFGLNLELPKPDVIDEAVILEQLAAHGRYGGEMGSCLRFCLPPHLRIEDPDYCRPFRRKRRGMDERLMKDRDGDARPVLPDRPATEHVAKLAFDMEMDLLGIAVQEDCDKTGLDIRKHLPDGNSLVVFGCRYPQIAQLAGSPEDAARPDEATGAALSDWVAFAQLDICRYLESLGYSALPGHEIDLGQAVEAAGLGKLNEQNRAETEAFGTRVIFGCLATSATLEPGRRVHAVSARRPADLEDAKLDLMALLMEEGADLVGVADPGCTDALIDQYRDFVDETELGVDVVDTGNYHGPVVAKITTDPAARIKNVRDYLAGARSVLVIGYRFPDLNLERAAEAPAEAVGPYSYACYQVTRWRRYMAVKAVRRLEEMGYRAVVCMDISGSGSTVANPRGRQPDALCNRFPAAAAGLCHIGLHGAPIHPEYGVTVRYIAVVTDADLPADEPLSEPHPCAECEAPCVEACPVAALDGDDCLVLGCGEFEACVGRWDRLRCEWAKKYALVGSEGPRWGGQSTDVRPPGGQITAEQIAEAFSEKDPIQKHFTCILEGCLKACQQQGAWGEENG